MTCKVCQVEFQQPQEHVTDWDDRQKTVQWLSSPKQDPEMPEQHVKKKVKKLMAMLQLEEMNRSTTIVDTYVVCLHTGDNDRS